jgi:NitT/TauT family transport system substrate-binding protein
VIGRRAFLRVSGAGASALLGFGVGRAGAEPPPETTTVRLVQVPSICRSPQYVAESLLRNEGFHEVRYVKKGGSAEVGPAVAAGEVDISMGFVGPLLTAIDQSQPLVILGPGHVGCFELFGNERVRAIRDLKGKKVAIPAWGSSSQHTFVASMVSYVGLDPRRDIDWVTASPSDSLRLFAEGKIDALIALPPEPQELRARKIGRVIVNSAVDQPWSQYFCCLTVANREFVRRHPVAAKRALRAILKAADVCALDPEAAARTLVDRGFVERYDYALQAMREIPYRKWRDYDVEDTVRFYSLRLHEAGLLKASPKKIIAQGTDWRFLNELRKELKG